MSGAAWRWAYNAAAPLMGIGMRIAARFNEKARDAFNGRKGWKQSLERQLKTRRTPDGRRLWIHAASVGEFEQAKPLLETLHPQYECVVSCFSPSVYGMASRFRFQDAVVYLPLDYRRNIRAFLDIVQPSAAVFSKFDVWPNCVWEASARGIPCALIAGTLHEGSKRLRPLARGLFRSVYQELRLQCAVTEEDAERLRELCGKTSGGKRSGAGPRILVAGDTRYDQVFARSKSVKGDPPERRGLTVVAGSIYAEDENVLLPAFARLKERRPDSGLCAVPHEPTESNLRALERRLKAHRLSYGRLSALGSHWRGADVVVVDSVGLLAGLYRFGGIAFVGGSFKARVHNVMEPAVFGKPVLFGPKIDNSPEAGALLKAGAAVKTDDENALADALIHYAEHPPLASEAGRKGREFILANLGAADRTLAALRPLIEEVSS